MDANVIGRQTSREKAGRRRALSVAVLAIFVVVLFLAMSSVALAAVTPDATSTNVGTGGTVEITHTTGADANLMLVGVAWNCGTTASENEVISSVTLGTTEMTHVYTQEAPEGDNRYVALYYLLDPTSGSGTVTVTFENGDGDTSADTEVAGGIVAGVATFAGVDPDNALGTAAFGNGGTPSNGGGATGAISVPAVAGDLVFDAVFKGGQNSEWTPDVSQTQLWNTAPAGTVYARGGASTKPCAADGNVSMTWTGTANGYWMAIGVALKPAPDVVDRNLTMGVSPIGAGTTTPAEGAHSYPDGTVVDITATPAAGYQFVNWTGDVVDADDPTTTVTMDADKTVTANFVSPVPDLDFTSPSGLQRLDSDEDTLTVGWTSDIDLDVGEFGIWARSAGGGWQSLGTVAANPADDLLTYEAAALSLPTAIDWYQVIIGYRATTGSGSWVSWATSYGYAFSVDNPIEPIVEITSPAGEQDLTATSSLTVSWTTQTAFSTGQFALWVRSPQGGWHWAAPLVAANGSTSYQTIIDLDEVAPAITSGLGYQVIVAYEPIANTSFWISWATSPGVFSVDALAPQITISAPDGIESWSDADSVLANWTTDQDLGGGEFGVWVRSFDGVGWYVTTLVPAAGTTGTVYNALLPLSTVPDGSGYQVIVAYRPVVGTGAWMSWSTSPGSFSVTSAQ